MTVITDKGPQLTENDLRAFEKEMRSTFPEDYRTFLLTHNGGQPKPYFFKVPGWQYQQSLVNELKGIVSNSQSVDLREDNSIMEGRLPKGFVSIGDDPGGNKILISLDGSTRGKIYFFDHENEPDVSTDKLEDYSNIYLLADSFDQFLNSLKEEDEL